MPQHIQIQRKTAPDAYETLVTFTDIPFIRAFYSQRGFQDNQHQKTNAISLHMLKRELTIEQNRAKSAGEPHQALEQAHQALATLLKSVKKEDELFYYGAFEPIPEMVSP